MSVKKKSEQFWANWKNFSTELLSMDLMYFSMVPGMQDPFTQPYNL